MTRRYLTCTKWNLVVIVAVTVACWAGAPAGAATIDVGSHNVAQGSSSFDIDIMISGGDLVTDMVGIIQIGDGGTIVGGADTGPIITAISYAGSIWSSTSAPGGFASFLTIPLPELIVDPNVSLNAAGQTVAASGVLLTITVDVTGVPAGTTRALMLGSTSAGSTALQNAGQGVALIINNGSITVDASPNRTWSGDSSGDWNNAGNWNGNVPDATDEIAIFGDVITSSRVVFTETDVTVRGVQFDSANTYTVVGTGTITIESDDNVTNPSIIQVLQGSHEFQAPVILANTTTVEVAAGTTLAFNNSVSTTSGTSMNVTGAGTVEFNNDLSVALTGAGDGYLGAVTVAGALVLGGGMLEVDATAYTGATESWTIMSAAGGITGTFGSVTEGYKTEVVGNDLILSLASALAPGDANGDGSVDLQDFSLLKANFGATSGAVWGQGDFNADGAVDLQDFSLLKANFGTAGAPVPEPATMSLLALAGLGLIRRKK